MLQESTKKTLSEMEEVKVFKALLPNVYDYYKNDEGILDVFMKLDIETFLYINMLNVDVSLYTKHVERIAKEYDIDGVTAIDNDNIIIYPEFLLKYVYIHMKDFEKENKK